MTTDFELPRYESVDLHARSSVAPLHQHEDEGDKLGFI